jgi:hypothetical protein
MKIPDFNSKQELYTFLKQNKNALIAEKKYAIKHGDCVSHYVLNDSATEQITKEITSPSTFTGNELKVSLVINTTNIMDSHSDVHIQGLWGKSLKETKLLYLLQEHQMSFEGIISDDIIPSVKLMSWKELGYNAEGNTQALIFNTSIPKDRNEYMFEQYMKGRVRNHSVGMQYIKIDLALNSESKFDEAEKKVWDKYIGQIINAKDAEAQGYFWAVTEAKLVEGSAVPMGSNKVTPVLSIEEKTEPSIDTQKDTEPINITRQLDYKYLINNLKIN